MSIDASVLHEAKTLLASFTQAARQAVDADLYGPREARLASAVVRLSERQVVVEHSFASETEMYKALEQDAAATIKHLVESLRATCDIIADNLVCPRGSKNSDVLMEACNAAEDAEAEWL